MDIKIITHQTTNGETETSEIFVSGEKKQRNGKTYISYKEPEENGLGSVLTAYKIDGDKLTISRYGEITSSMHFSQGEITRCKYEMACGTFSLEIMTKKIEIDLIKEENGRIYMEYIVEIDQKESVEHIVEIIITN